MQSDTKVILEFLSQFQKNMFQSFRGIETRLINIDNRLLLLEKELFQIKEDTNRLDNKIIAYADTGRFDAVTRTELRHFAELNELKYTP